MIFYLIFSMVGDKLTVGSRPYAESAADLRAAAIDAAAANLRVCLGVRTAAGAAAATGSAGTVGTVGAGGTVGTAASAADSAGAADCSICNGMVQQAKCELPFLHCEHSLARTSEERLCERKRPFLIF